MSSLVEIRVFHSGQRTENWKEVGVSSYLPALVTGDLLADNIKNRLKVGYFKQDPTIDSIRWNLKHTPDDGIWVFRGDL